MSPSSTLYPDSLFAASLSALQADGPRLFLFLNEIVFAKSGLFDRLINIFRSLPESNRFLFYFGGNVYRLNNVRLIRT